MRAALIDAFVIYLACYLPLGNADAVLSKGYEYGMWASGMTVYVGSCFVANFWLIMRFNQHDCYSSFAFLLMLVAPFFFYWLLSIVISGNPIYGEYGVQMGPNAGGLIPYTYVFVTLYVIV